MTRYTYLLIILCATTLHVFGQEKYTEVIQRVSDGKGTIVLHQSEDIDNLVNANPVLAETVNTASAKKPTVPVQKSLRQLPDSLADSTSVAPVSGQRIRVNGYRIQVYSGGNTRKGKAEATMMGQRVKSYFDSLPVYTHFVSPHWICRCGDFRTYEEANEYFSRMKESGRFPEAVIVKCKVSVIN